MSLELFVEIQWYVIKDRDCHFAVGYIKKLHDVSFGFDPELISQKNHGRKIKVF